MSIRKSERLVLGLDCSTTGVKAIAFDARGRAVAQARVPIPLATPQPGYFEQNPLDWWESTQQALRSVLRRVDAASIEALSISNQRETFVPLGADGKPLRPAIVWLDERCRGEVEPFAEKIGRRRLHRITGKPVDYAPVVYRLAWMKKFEPRLFANIRMVCDVHTYLVWKLTDNFRTSWASADPTGMFDMENKKWSAPILSALALGETQLPETACSGTILGIITAAAAKTTGLRSGTLIVAGGGDGQAAGGGAGALSARRAYLNLGTAVVAGVYGSRYRISDAFRTMNSCSAKGYYYECSLRAGTFALDWFVQSLLKIDVRRHPSIYQVLEAEAAEVAPGCDGLFFLPYLNGVMNPYWNMSARGVFSGLGSFHRRGHLYRAILEGIAFEQLLALAAVEEETGERVRELVTIGGGAASPLWCRILADITGKEILLPQTQEASGLGAGIAAAVGAGWFDGFREAVDRMTGIRKAIQPNAARHRRYRQQFLAYREIYPRLHCSMR